MIMSRSRGRQGADTPPSYHEPPADADPRTAAQLGSPTTRDAAKMHGTLQPWLGLRARLVLSPISVALIAVVFVGARLLGASSDVSTSIGSTKLKLLAACDAVEERASLAASLPHLMSASVNAHVAQSVTATVHGAGRIFDLSLTAIEKTLGYMVHSYRSLLLCFIELLVRGSLAVLIEAAQLVSQAVNSAALGIRAAIQDSVQGVNAILATAVQGVNDVVGVFGHKISAPAIAVPSLAALEDIQLPHEIQDGLLKLNQSLPTLQQLRETMDRLIQTPFEQMRHDVNATIAGFSFDDAILPVPERQNLSFCHTIDTTPIDKLGHELAVAARWGLALLGLVAVAVVLVSIVNEWLAWHKEQQGIRRTTALWLAQQQQCEMPEKHATETGAGKVLEEREVMSLLTISRSALSHTIVAGACGRMGVRSRWAQDRVVWLCALLSHPAALACLYTGVLGLLCVALQTLLVRRLTHHYVALVDDSLTGLEDEVLALVESSARNASVAFAASANAVISEVQEELNTHVFRWVDTTTLTMNATLNQFLDGITDTLTTTFGSTPFNAPLQTFVQCILGQKIRGIEKALTWIHNNAHVEFSLVEDDVFVPSALHRDAVLHPIRTALLGDGGDDAGGLAGHVVGKYLRHLEQEKILFAALTAVYLVVALGGILVVVYATIVDSRYSQDAFEDRSEPAAEMEEKPPVDGPAPEAPRWARFISKLRKASDDTVSDDGKHPQVSSTHVSRSVHDSLLAECLRAAPTRTHVAKDSISYPFQIHSSFSAQPTYTLSAHRPRGPSHSRRSTSPPYRRSAMETPTPKERSSWLSFLVAQSSADAARPEESVAESAHDKFERLFGCSPAASPTSPRFEANLSAPPASGPKHRRTVDLLLTHDWIGARSPVPQTEQHRAPSQGAPGKEETAVELVRASRGAGESAAEADSYPYDRRHAERARPHRQPSAQSISFYAW